MLFFRLLFLPLHFLLEASPFFFFPFAPQQQNNIIDCSGSHPSDTDKGEYIVITRIRVTNVLSGIRRIPAGFHASIEIGRGTTKTANKPAAVDEDVVEWDTEVFLPSQRSTVVSFRVYASFELGSTLGVGELLRQFKITVGDILDHDDQLQSVQFPASRDQVFPSCSSVRIFAERRICSISEFETRLNSPMSDTVNDLEWLTDAGHGALIRYRHLQNQADLDEAITCFHRVYDICPPGHPHCSAVLLNFANAMFIHSQVSNHLLGLDVSITLYSDALRLRTASHPDYCTTALALCFAFLTRFHVRGNRADRMKADALLSQVMGLLPADSYGYRAACFALQMMETSLPVTEPGISSDENTHPDDEELIWIQSSILLDSSDDVSCLPVILTNLGDLLYGQVEGNVDAVCIRAALSKLEHTARLVPDEHPEKPSLWNNLGSSSFRLFERFGVIVDINKSISLFEQAVHLTTVGHPDQAIWLNNLASSLFCRYQCLGDLVDLNKCISMNEKAVQLTPDDDPGKPASLSNLGSSLVRRFERLGDLADMEKSVSVSEEAVRLTADGNPAKSSRLSHLAVALACRFKNLGNLADINRSISMHEEAVHILHDGHPDKPARLTNLGGSLARRFERLGDTLDINRSISMFEEALTLMPPGHPEKLALLFDLVPALLRRFQHLGDLTDIDKSISVAEEAVRLTPDGHPHKPSLLNSLASSLASRFENLGDLTDIDKSISTSEEAVRLAADGHPNKPACLNYLGSSLFRHFERVGKPMDIDRAVSAFEEAVRLTSDGHPDRPVLLNNLGSSIQRRFERLGNLADIDKFISMHEEALRLIPQGHPDRPTALGGLGDALSCRFDRFHDLTDIQRLISMREEAVSLTPDGHPDKPSRLIRLGAAFLKYSEHSKDTSGLTTAISHFSVASRTLTGPTMARFSAARLWIMSLQRQGDTHALLDAYGTAIQLLPQLAWLGLPLTERHRVLHEAADIARDAAAAALEAGCPDAAVEWLEQGRSIVWSQFLQLRTPVDDLRVEHPHLADSFQQVSKELEHASSRDDGLVLLHTTEAISSLPENVVQRHHGLALKRDKRLVEIRSLPGFERFLLPKTIEQLVGLANSGPVVYLNASTQRCDALIVMAELGVTLPVHLSKVSYREVEVLRGMLRLLLERHRLIISREDISSLVPDEWDVTLQDFLTELVTDNAKDDGRAAKVKSQRVEEYRPDDLFRRILAYLWDNVVSPVLDALGFPTPRSGMEDKIRIFWCATGPFAFLPIHAAGLYDTPDPGTKLSDFAISSYVPTLSSRASSSPIRSNDNGPFNIRLVAVPQPPTDGLLGLVSVKEEIDHIKTLSRKSPFVILENSDGTIEDVMEKMKNADWVHFACHGVQDPHEPLNSGLCLANGRRLKLSDIIRLSRPQGGLAFLSACQTAQGDDALAEESVHLAAGMLLAGYGGVIATMWAIMDVDAPKVTREVYESLFREGRIPDGTEAAEALHDAVQRLRGSGASFMSWVPFIHVGR